MSTPRSPYARSTARETLRLRDLALDNRERVYRTPSMSDWLWLSLLSLALIGNGVYVWHSRGASDHIGRAVFFGLVLVALFWSTLLYLFKLSVAVKVGPFGLSLVRGPWRTELAWAEVGRLTERIQAANGRRYRWIVALARDGRELRVREDMVVDYMRFRVEVYERYRLWRDHGGTGGTTGIGPFHADESITSDLTWWGLACGVLLLPGVYLWALLPETGLIGPLFVLLGLATGGMAVRAFLRRHSYELDGTRIKVSQPFRQPLRLPWREIARVERIRHPFSGAINVGIAVGRFALALAARTDRRFESFVWTPRVPEYLVLRGGGRSVRISLHRLSHPDEMLAWVEFYERIGRRVAQSDAATEARPRRNTLSAALPPASPVEPGGALAEPPMPAPADAPSAPGIPADPWSGVSDDDSAFLIADGPEAPHAFPTMPQPMQEPEPQPSSPVYTGGDAAWQAPTWDLPVHATHAGETHAPSTPIAEPWQREPAADSMPAESSEPGGSTLSSVQSSFTSRWAQPIDDWMPTEAALPGAERPSAAEPPAPPAQPAYPAHPSSAYAPLPGQAQVEWRWPSDAADQGDDDSAPTDDEFAPTDPVESLADSFAPWREDGWTRPPLPRFGPATTEE